MVFFCKESQGPLNHQKTDNVHDNCQYGHQSWYISISLSVFSYILNSPNALEWGREVEKVVTSK